MSLKAPLKTEQLLAIEAAKIVAKTIRDHNASPTLPIYERIRTWYNSPAWKALRWNQLKHSPLCRLCSERGEVTEANTVDHIIRHKGRMELFFNVQNLQSLCKTCHDSIKSSQERSRNVGSKDDGTPLIEQEGW